MAKVMLATGLIVVYGYAMEAFFGWYSANEYEYFMIKNRIWNGPYWGFYWLLILCNGLSIQLLWFKRFRESEFWLFVISIIVSIGMWLERFVIIVTSLHRDFLPANWAMYSPTMFDLSMFMGTIGFFFTLVYLFVRFLPIISIFEVRTLLPEAQVEEHGHAHEPAGIGPLVHAVAQQRQGALHRERRDGVRRDGDSVGCRENRFEIGDIL